MKLIDKILYDARVVGASDERSSGDGFWVYLAPGYINEFSETHCIHEDTLTACYEQLKDDITTCRCKYCTEAIKTTPAAEETIT